MALLDVKVERLPLDLVSRAQLMAIDATAFPEPSLRLGLPSAEAAFTWVAREPERGIVMGFASAARQPPGLYVFGIAVAAEHRGRGVGRALVRALVAAARGIRVESVGLHVAVGNEPAVRLYTSEGFEVIGSIPDYYRFGATRTERAAYKMMRVV